MYDPGSKKHPRTTYSTRGYLRTVAALLCGTVGAIEVSAVRADCPPPNSSEVRSIRTPSASAPSATADVADSGIQIQSSQAEVDRDGNVVLTGKVEIAQGDHELRTEQASYDAKTQNISVPGNVEYSDPNLAIRGES